MFYKKHNRVEFLFERKTKFCYFLKCMQHVSPSVYWCVLKTPSYTSSHFTWYFTGWHPPPKRTFEVVQEWHTVWKLSSSICCHRVLSVDILSIWLSVVLQQLSYMCVFGGGSFWFDNCHLPPRRQRRCHSHRRHIARVDYIIAPFVENLHFSLINRKILCRPVPLINFLSSIKWLSNFARVCAEFFLCILIRKFVGLVSTSLFFVCCYCRILWFMIA